MKTKDDNNAQLERDLAAAREREGKLREALTNVSKWCHNGHGAYPAKQCGLCSKVFAALAAPEAEGKSNQRFVDKVKAAWADNAFADFGDKPPEPQPEEKKMKSIEMEEEEKRCAKDRAMNEAYRRMGWLSPAEAEGLRRLETNARQLRDTYQEAGWALKKDRDEQRARAEKAEAELSQVKARAERSEAQCAAMREALNNAIQSAKQSHINHCGPWEKYGRHAPECYADEAEEYEAALKSDAGRGYVKAERLKEVRDQIKSVRQRLGDQFWENGIIAQMVALTGDALYGIETRLDTLLAESEGAG